MVEWGGDLLIYLLAGVSPFVYPEESALARKLQAGWWAWEQGKSTGSEGMWALFKNHFQPGWVDQATWAI